MHLFLRESFNSNRENAKKVIKTQVSVISILIWRNERISHPTDYDTDFNRVLHVTSLDITGKRDKDAGWTICKYPCPDFFSASRNRSVNGRGVFEAADAVECY